MTEKEKLELIIEELKNVLKECEELRSMIIYERGKLKGTIDIFEIISDTATKMVDDYNSRKEMMAERIVRKIIKIIKKRLTNL